MTSLAAKVKRVLEHEFWVAQARLRMTYRNGRVAGVLEWEGFNGVDQIERQRLLRERLHERLDDDEFHRLSAILTLTPGEARGDLSGIRAA